MEKRDQNFHLKETDLSWQDLKDILDYCYDEIFVIDSQGIVIYVNDACIRNYGATPEELIGKHVMYVEEKGYCSPVLASAFLGSKESLTLQQTTVYGTVLTVTSSPVFNRDGSLRFVVLSSRDITDITLLRKDLANSRHLEEKYRGKLADSQNLVSSGIIAESEEMKACLNLARKVSSTDANILLLGESGVGKSLMANYIHNVSNRKSGRMVRINCASIPENLLESELFGYCKGAFSGAEKRGKQGLVEMAHKGTLFLDEIGEMSPALQAKILQLIQDHSFIPLGGTEEVKVDIRIIAATNIDIRQAIEEGNFREDLFYRLSVIEINVPPLRERQGDIEFLIDYFLNKLNAKYYSNVALSPEATELFLRYPWPGNIRELEHLLERLALTSDNSTITPEDLPEQFKNFMEQKGDLVPLHKQIEKPKASYREMEIERILDLYEKLHSSYKVADELNISQSKATRIINKYYKNTTDTLDKGAKKKRNF